MALTRKFLKGMGLNEEQVDTIIEAHAETVDGLKAVSAQYKADSEKLAEVQRELDAFKAKGDEGWKDKHDTVKKEFDEYKAAQEAKEVTAAKETAYRALLKGAGVDEKRLDSIIRVTDLNTVEMDGASIKNADSLTESVKTEWSDFITGGGTGGMKVDTGGQLGGGGSPATRAEIMKIRDPAKRQQAIAENIDLFQKG